MNPRIASLLASFAVTAFASGALAAPTATPLWRSEFEKGFPGEFTDYKDCTYTATGTPKAGATSAWTFMDAPAGVGSISGSKIYKGWILGPETDAGCTKDTSHRPYPVVHNDFPTPLMNTFWVWVDVDWSKLANPTTDWHHLGTWGPNTFWDVHTLTIFRRKLSLAHMKTTTYVGPMPQPEFPMKKSVKIGVYLHYKGANPGDMAVWQDGKLMFKGTVGKPGGTSLLRTHWGLYANGQSNHGVQYNDDIQIWKLSEPLTDFSNEPASPYAPPMTPDAGPSDSGVVDDSGPTDAGDLAVDDAGPSIPGKDPMGDDPAAESSTEDGASCSVSRSASSPVAALAMAITAAVLLRRRRAA